MHYVTLPRILTLHLKRFATTSRYVSTFILASGEKCEGKALVDILSKTKIKKKSPTVIVENGVTHTDKLNIANKFNQFFTNIAHTLARDIKYDGTKNYKYYLNKHINTLMKKRLSRRYKTFPQKIVVE